MFTPEEISGFFDGRSGGFLELTYDGEEGRVLFHRRAYGDVIATIPARSDRNKGSFCIKSALSAPECGVSFASSDSAYSVNITKRFQIRSIIKIAINHLNWIDEARLQERIFTSCSD